MSIRKRTVFYDKTGGIIRFWDWALTTTDIGSMVEPFEANDRTTRDGGIRNFDATDECTRIDDMREADIGQSLLLLSGGNTQIHGGCLIPRTGR